MKAEFEEVIPLNDFINGFVELKKEETGDTTFPITPSGEPMDAWGRFYQSMVLKATMGVIGKI